MALACPPWRPGGALLRCCARWWLGFACRAGPRLWSGSAPQVAPYFFLFYFFALINAIMGLVFAFDVLLYLVVGWAGATHVCAQSIVPARAAV